MTMIQAANSEPISSKMVGTMKLEDVMRQIMNTYNTSDGYYMDAGINCPICNNRGNHIEILWKDGLPYEELVECECQSGRKVRRTAERSGLSPFLDMVFDTFRTDSDFHRGLKKLAFKNAKSEDWFYIGGQTGAGKTHITCAIANHLTGIKNSIKYSTWMQDIKSLNFMMHDRAEYESRLNELKNVEVLLIDDLFKRSAGERITNTDTQIMLEIINHRYMHRKKTIISSEDSLDMLVRVDEAIAGRIKERCGEFVVNIGKDFNKNMRFTI